MKKNLSIIFNVIIIIFVIVGSYLMFSGIKFMGPEDGYSATKLAMLRFYTVDSNILMGIASLLFIINIVKEKRRF